MIQELLGESKISFPFSPISSSPIFPSTSTPILTATTATATATATATTSSTTNVANLSNTNLETTTTEKLRCPRCDSTNTKFCYYNNYNLTQPRHFCKTCRRYWTKGGTLRNVPIGGGCRKNRSSGASGGSSTTNNQGGMLSKSLLSSSNTMAKASSKATNLFSTEMLLNGIPGFLGNGLLDHLNHHHSELQPPGPISPILWPSMLPQPQNSHILSLLRRPTQFPNNPSPNPKTEGITTTATTTLGLDPYGNGAPSMFGSSFSRSNPNQLNGFGVGGPDLFVQNSGCSSNIIELYQRLKSNENQRAVILGNAIGSSSLSSSPSSTMNYSTVFEAVPVEGAGNHLGGYNIMNSSTMSSSWSDLPTVPINGAFP